MIYVKLKGRLGNQLFMYAIARRLQIGQKNPEVIVFEDVDNVRLGFENSLREYDLKNVEYVYDLDVYNSEFKFQAFVLRILAHFERSMDLKSVYLMEKKLQPLLKVFHILRMQDGYVETPKFIPKKLLVDGYFQCEKYFEPVKEEIIDTFVLHELLDEVNYPNIDKIRSRNTVCVTIRVGEDYRNNPMYNVCSPNYWREAIELIVKQVKNPLFFLCADDIELAKTYVPMLNEYECIEQAKEFGAHITLSAMAECKHFVISNSSFSWWAQYLSRYSGKIVIAPSKWYSIDMPEDIMQSNWQIIEV